MKEITDDLEILNYLKSLLNTKEKLWAWQQESAESKITQFIVIKRVDHEKKTIQVNPYAGSEFRFKKKLDLFVHSEKAKLALKVTPREIDQTFMVLPFPKKINELTDEMISKLQIIEKENESAFMDKRDFTRKQIDKEQFASILHDKQDGVQKVEVHLLYDLSQGGMAILTVDPGNFATGDEVSITAIGSNVLKKPYNGIVRSIRQLSEPDKSYFFKIGIQFT